MNGRFENITDIKTHQFVRDRLCDIVQTNRTGRSGRSLLYLLPYDPEQQEGARELVDVLVEKDLPANGIEAVDINLYDIVLAYLDEDDTWEPLCEEEPNMERRDIIQLLRDTVSVSDVLAPAIQARIQDGPEGRPYDLAIITGVGETYPYVRTHTLLEALDTPVPVVLMFPGKYSRHSDGGTSLDILDIPSRGNGGHYRATNVFDL